ncbi:unnamed protein product [Amoebophrya sp. A120]|nr:unnamed protein product [Amoebophrya sp. A120]|eukprot:GSA120T00012533001.1
MARPSPTVAVAAVPDAYEVGTRVLVVSAPDDDSANADSGRSRTGTVKRIGKKKLRVEFDSGIASEEDTSTRQPEAGNAGASVGRDQDQESKNEWVKPECVRKIVEVVGPFSEKRSRPEVVVSVAEQDERGKETRMLPSRSDAKRRKVDGGVKGGDAVILAESRTTEGPQSATKPPKQSETLTGHTTTRAGGKPQVVTAGERQIRATYSSTSDGKIKMQSNPPASNQLFCNHCRQSGHVAKTCHYGAVSHQRFLRCLDSSTCFPRQFLVLLRRACPDFEVDNLRDGRVDVGVSSVSAALFRSQSLRHNTSISLVMTGNKKVTGEGALEMKTSKSSTSTLGADDAKNDNVTEGNPRSCDSKAEASTSPSPKTVTFYASHIRDLKCDDLSIASRLKQVSAETRKSLETRLAAEEADRDAWSQSAFRGLQTLEHGEGAEVSECVREALELGCLRRDRNYKLAPGLDPSLDPSESGAERTNRSAIKMHEREAFFRGQFYALKQGTDGADEKRINTNVPALLQRDKQQEGDMETTNKNPIVFLLSGGSTNHEESVSTERTSSKPDALKKHHAVGRSFEEVLSEIMTDEKRKKQLADYGCVCILGDDRGLLPADEKVIEDTVLSPGRGGNSMQKNSCSSSASNDNDSTRSQAQATDSQNLFRVTLGREILFTNQCIVLLHHYLDKVCHSCTLPPPRRLATNNWAGRGQAKGGARGSGNKESTARVAKGSSGDKMTKKGSTSGRGTGGKSGYGARGGFSNAKCGAKGGK